MKILTLSAIGGLVALTAIPQTANAGPRYNTYDVHCEQDRRNSQLAGSIIGGILGAAIGHEVAANNSRDEGLVIGGALGAAIGAGAGNNRVACAEPRRAYRPAPSVHAPAYGHRYYRHSRVVYDTPHTYEPDPYDRDYDRDVAYHEPVYRYKPICKMGESRIELPDGRVDRRAVKMCRGDDGVWRVVDK